MRKSIVFVSKKYFHCHVDSYLKRCHDDTVKWIDHHELPERPDHGRIISSQQI